MYVDYKRFMREYQELECMNKIDNHLDINSIKLSCYNICRITLYAKKALLLSSR